MSLGSPNPAPLTAAALQDHLVKKLSLSTQPFSTNIRPLKRTQKPRYKHIKSVVDSGLGKKDLTVKETGKWNDTEYVIDQPSEPQTLAQRLGLVERPNRVVSEDEWVKLKEKSNQRSDSKQPCAICRDYFGLNQQVLLSCSHVFHRACLDAFERFCGRKTCPLCRKEQYQRRVIHQGAKFHRVRCATLIQAAWRGYLMKKWYKQFRLSHPPQDPILRKKFFENKLAEINNRLVRSMAIDYCSLFDEIDQNVKRNRELLRRFEILHHPSIIDWSSVYQKALNRSGVSSECPICLNVLCLQNKNSTCDKQSMLLSCSHVFHATCLSAFESYSLDRTYACPVCRSQYQKRSLFDF